MSPGKDRDKMVPVVEFHGRADFRDLLVRIEEKRTGRVKPPCTTHKAYVLGFLP